MPSDPGSGSVSTTASVVPSAAFSALRASFSSCRASSACSSVAFKSLWTSAAASTTAANVSTAESDQLPSASPLRISAISSLALYTSFASWLFTSTPLIRICVSTPPAISKNKIARTILRPFLSRMLHHPFSFYRYIPYLIFTRSTLRITFSPNTYRKNALPQACVASYGTPEIYRIFRESQLIVRPDADT